MKAGRRVGPWLALVLAFSVATRLAYLIAYRHSDPLYDHLLHDAKRYHEWAQALARGESWEAGPYYQAPLYPYLLAGLYAALGARPLVGYVFQSLCGAATVWVVCRIGRRTFGARGGLVAAALTALYGVLVYFETKLVPASVSVLIAALAIDRIQVADRASRDRAWLLPGAVAGLGAVANPSALLLVAVVSIWIAMDRARRWPERLRRAGLLILGAACVVAPVTVRNGWIGHDPVLVSTNGGVTFYQGNGPGAAGVFSIPEGFSGAIFRQREESRALAEKEVGRPLRDSEVSSFWLRKGLACLAAEPGRTLELVGRKAAFALDNHEHPLEYDPQLDSNPVRFLMPLPFGLVLALAAARLVTSPRPTRGESPLFLSLAATGMVLLAFYVSSRYRLPALPALLVLAGGGAVRLLDRLRSTPREAILPGLAAAAVALVSFLPMPLRDPARYAQSTAMAICDLAGAFVADGQAGRAVELYRRAVSSDPSYPYAHLDLGKALLVLGDRSGAERAVREALRLAPELSEAHLDLGVVLDGEGRLDEAATAFAEAFRLDPASSAAGNNFIGTSLRMGRYPQAIAAWREMKRRALPVDPPLESWMLRNAR